MHEPNTENMCERPMSVGRAGNREWREWTTSDWFNAGQPTINEMMNDQAMGLGAWSGLATHRTRGTRWLFEQNYTDGDPNRWGSPIWLPFRAQFNWMQCLMSSEHTALIHWFAVFWLSAYVLPVRSFGRMKFALNIEYKWGYLLLIFMPPRTGFGDCLLPSAKEVVLGLPPLMSSASRLSVPGSVVNFK